MTDAPQMPSRLHTLKRTAKKLILGRRDLDTLMDAVVAFSALCYSVGVLLVRVVLFLLLPLSVVLLYPAIRANHRRWHQYADKHRAEVIAGMTRLSRKEPT
jgi:uncharacterized membrane protein